MSESFLASRYIIGVSVAIPAASLCINRRLYLITTVQSVTKSKAEKHRDVMVDLAIGLGIPLLEMILRTFVRDINCSRALTPPADRIHCARASFQYLRRHWLLPDDL